MLPELIGSEADGLGAVVDRLITDGTSIVEVASESDAHVTLAGLFDEQVERTPDALALDYAGTQLTYAQFDARANRLARELVAAGVGPDSLVGLAMRRSIDLLVSMYAIVKAGGAYVPLDPDHPADRLAYVLEIAKPTAVLTRTSDAVVLPHGTPTLDVDTLDLSGRAETTVTDATGWRRCARTTLRMSSSRPDRPDAPKALQSLTVPSSRTCNGVRPSTDSLPTT